jgi:hypothetical protein
MKMIPGLSIEDKESSNNKEIITRIKSSTIEMNEYI